LKKLLASLPNNIDKNVLVGFDTSDDAGVYQLSAEQALVYTVDFITPPVDDPYLFGQIAAANSLSDIYAMGGKPLSCLNIAGFPADKLDSEILTGIISGALQKITEAGAVLLGGHTTDNDEPIFGLTVTGMVHPENIWRNSGAQPGDQLILTKALGSGVLFNANLKNLVSAKALGECLDSLIVLNKTAAEVFADFEIHAATDITGFGFAGHALEMLSGPDLSFNITLDAIPIMNEAREMYKRGVTTGVNQTNRTLVENNWNFAEGIPVTQQELMLDPQTSGGLLVAVPEAQTSSILKALHNAGVTSSAQIGYVSNFSESKLCFR
jgi:selenide,water dikinase|tara:strand:+ start:918 stop:1889 length:972 start_codon:yes stop_codon:yes gene_type:complete